jgi:hypothetical protein
MKNLERKQVQIEVVRESDISGRLYEVLFKSKQKNFSKIRKGTGLVDVYLRSCLPFISIYSNQNA